MAEWGLTAEEVSDQTLTFWPDCAAALDVFLAVNTQWRTGPGGIIGLDYTAVRDVLRDFLRVPRAQWPDLFRDLRVMEQGALAERDKG